MTDYRSIRIYILKLSSFVIGSADTIIPLLCYISKLFKTVRKTRSTVLEQYKSVPKIF